MRLRNNPVFMLDELDKIGQDFRGDPASALLEVLDPEQNNSFTDHYLDQPFDLSNVMFIGTANYTEPVPPALLDRMEVIELPGYTAGEKLQHRQEISCPAAAQRTRPQENATDYYQMTPFEVIIDSYTREAGVRNLERTIGSVCRFAATKIANEPQEAWPSNAAIDLPKSSAPLDSNPKSPCEPAIPGVVTGLAYTPFGGEILFVEAAAMPGKGTSSSPAKSATS